jgi:chromosome segregation ATPase
MADVREQAVAALTQLLMSKGIIGAETVAKQALDAIVPSLFVERSEYERVERKRDGALRALEHERLTVSEWLSAAAGAFTPATLRTAYNDLSARAERAEARCERVKRERDQYARNAAERADARDRAEAELEQAREELNRLHDLSEYYKDAADTWQAERDDLRAELEQLRQREGELLEKAESALAAAVRLLPSAEIPAWAIDEADFVRRVQREFRSALSDTGDGGET